MKRHLIGEMGQARFLREGVSPADRPVAHVLAGSGRFKIDDELVSVGPRGVVYGEPASIRGWEAGPDGLELLAFGAHAERDAEMEMV